MELHPPDVGDIGPEAEVEVEGDLLPLRVGVRAYENGVYLHGDVPNRGEDIQRPAVGRHIGVVHIHAAAASPDLVVHRHKAVLPHKHGVLLPVVAVALEAAEPLEEDLPLPLLHPLERGGELVDVAEGGGNHQHGVAGGDLVYRHAVHKEHARPPEEVGDGPGLGGRLHHHQHSPEELHAPRRRGHPSLQEVSNGLPVSIHLCQHRVEVHLVYVPKLRLVESELQLPLERVENLLVVHYHDAETLREAACV